MDRVLVWGASGHAQIVTELLELSGLYVISGYIDDVNSDREGQEFEGAVILGGRKAVERAAKSGVNCLIVAIGDCVKRKEACQFGLSVGLRLINAIHPSAVVSTKASLGVGIVCSAGSVICPYAIVGDGAIINTSASIDHGCAIGPYAHVAPGARLAGNVTVGECAWIGIGATVKDRVNIGSYAVVGAGSVVIRDIPGGCVAYGVPAKVQRTQDAGRTVNIGRERNG
jgi:acetyltransferase EpsM